MDSNPLFFRWYKYCILYTPLIPSGGGGGGQNCWCKLRKRVLLVKCEYILSIGGGGGGNTTRDRERGYSLKLWVNLCMWGYYSNPNKYYHLWGWGGGVLNYYWGRGSITRARGGGLDLHPPSTPKSSKNAFLLQQDWFLRGAGGK